MTTGTSAGSASIVDPDYWWYRARTGLLRTALESHVGSPRRILDVGSADGPSVEWLRDLGSTVSLDVDPRGLSAGGVCGSASQLPFADGSFDVVAAFDVIEHCHPEGVVLAEIARVLSPGGRLIASVPAYQWAWTDFDVENGHYRRYTKSRLVDAMQSAGFHVDRATYAFTAVFPFFAGERLVRRVRESWFQKSRAHERADIVTVPALPRQVERMFLSLCDLDRRLLASRDLPFGSSVLVAATAPREDDR